MFIADFHIHSKYSRATSKECVPEMLELWARRKGLDLIGTGDFTHPAWREELKEKLVPAEEGLYALKDDFRRADGTAGIDRHSRFIVTGEISSIYKKNGRVRKVHNLILLPSLEAAEALSRRLEAIGNLHSDGRPILGLDSKDLLEMTLDVCPDALFIPAHIWTPHFSLFGAYSGFDTIEECFGDLTGHIHALETGLSSDPPMNWRLSALDRFTLVSNSDAHSPANLAREANLFDTALTYPHIARALQNRDTAEFSGTIEFFPEEGKYHYDGHRNCKVCLTPSDTLAASGVCPACGGRITVGVLHRVEDLADRKEGFVPPSPKRFESLIPLKELIAASMGLTAASKKVQATYDGLIQALGPELLLLRQTPPDDIEFASGPSIAEGIRRLRSGKVEVLPGYDGEYGKIKIFEESELSLFSGQICLFQQERKTPASEKSPQQSGLPIKTEAVATDAARQAEASEAAHASPSDVLDGLNAEQLEAVSSPAPVLAVIAGPGTGKTRTLVSRIAYLVQKCGVPPSQITAVTFTNRAANEMRARLTKVFGSKDAVKAMTIGTFHSICLKILSERNETCLTLLDERNALSILEDTLQLLHLKGSPRDALSGISLLKSGVQPSGGKPSVPPGVYDLYCAQLAQYGALDYDDILLRALGLFEGAAGPEGRDLRTPFSYLLVDEFQDINPVQYRLIREWGKDNAGIFVIGDPDQSIYGFRGADAHCFERFFEDFPSAQEVHLGQNYRSTPEVIECARQVISEGNAEKDAYALEAKREHGFPVRLLEAESDFSEALFVTKEINRMVGGIDMLDAHTASAFKESRPVSENARGLSEIAVLYRTNRQAAILEECLLKEGIPYTVAGHDNFLADREVRKTVSFFRFLLNPADLVSLSFCLKTIDGCRGEYVQTLLGLYGKSDKSIASFLDSAEKHFLSSAAAEPRKFSELLEKYAPLVEREKPQELIEAWRNDNGLEDVRSMELFFNMAVLHETMSSLLQNLLLGRESDLVRSGGRSYSPDAVSLMTLHAAKGLEFPVVFLCGVKDGIVPLKNRADDCDPDEERRLFYVGMTRAQDELLLLTSPTRSPFLASLPAGLFLTESVCERKRTPDFEQISFF